MLTRYWIAMPIKVLLLALIMGENCMSPLPRPYPPPSESDQFMESELTDEVASVAALLRPVPSTIRVKCASDRAEDIEK